MPVNVTDIADYQRRVGAVSDRLEARWQSALERVVRLFWRRLGAYGSDPFVLQTALGQLESGLRSAISGLHRDAILAWSEFALDEMSARSSKRLTIIAERKTLGEEIRESAGRWSVATLRARAAEITQSLLDRARRLIGLGTTRGDDPETIGRTLSQQGSDAESRARTIARSEVQRVRNEIERRTLETTGIAGSYKQWVTAGDEKVRASHRFVEAADGPSWIASGARVVPYGANFSVGGEEAFGPRDESLSAEQKINCRCSLVIYERLPEGAIEE